MSNAPDSPYTWIWKEIAQRFGAQQATDLYEQFLAQQRAYQRSYRSTLADGHAERGNERQRNRRCQTLRMFAPCAQVRDRLP